MTGPRFPTSVIYITSAVGPVIQHDRYTGPTFKIH